jgi:hypothetical protein
VYLKELEQLRNINESRDSYQKLKKSQKIFNPGERYVRIRRAESLSGDEMFLGRLVECFDELLNANVSDQSEGIGITES